MGEVLSTMALQTLTTIGVNVRFIRKTLLDMNLTPMSEMTGVSRDVLCRLEALASGDGMMGKDRVYPSLPTLIKFCESTGIGLCELLTVDVVNCSDIQSVIINHCKVPISKLKDLGK